MTIIQALLFSFIVLTAMADPVVDCVASCRTALREFDGMTRDFGCECGANCTTLITQNSCVDRCQRAVNYTYDFALDTDTFCDIDSCECVCPTRPYRTVDNCKRHCNIDLSSQFISFDPGFDEQTRCFFENCTCGSVCLPQPSIPSDCTLVVGKRASRVVQQFDAFGCKSNTCIYEDCPDALQDFPDLANFCWNTCPPATYPQGCVETTLDSTQCLKCQCAAQPPSQNSCGGLPSFAVVISTPFCQKYCNLIHGENRRQGSVLLTSPRSCGCVALTDLYCDDLCRETQSREGSVGNGKRCECTNLPTRLANLRRRCTNVCGWHHMSWTGSTSGQLCVCA